MEEKTGLVEDFWLNLIEYRLPPMMSLAQRWRAYRQREGGIKREKLHNGFGFTFQCCSGMAMSYVLYVDKCVKTFCRESKQTSTPTVTVASMMIPLSRVSHSPKVTLQVLTALYICHGMLRRTGMQLRCAPLGHS